MADRSDRAIFLIGLMGSGKSEVGAALAKRLRRQFLDTDEMVEIRAGRSIEEIFEKDGEAAFREMETNALIQAAGHAGAVIACGGGAVLDPSNVEVMRAGGTVLYLKVDPKAAAARVGTGRARPMLKDVDVASRMKELMVRRAAAYEAAADVIVDANGSVEETLAQVLEALERPVTRATLEE